jgi:hypothetical protein
MAVIPRACPRKRPRRKRADQVALVPSAHVKRDDSPTPESEQSVVADLADLDTAIDQASGAATRSLTTR